MSKSIFISYVYEDKEHRDILKDWSNRGLLGDKIQITYERGDYRSKGKTAIKHEILSMIQGAAAVIFLIGQNTHNHPWVKYEIECAIGKNRKCLAVRIPGTTGGRPQLLKDHSELPFDVNYIKASIQHKYENG